MQGDSQEYSNVEVGTSRSFGFVFAAVFLIIGLFPLIGSSPPRIWALGIAGAFALVAMVAPKVLDPLNRLWFQFGMLLGRIVNPVVMLIIFLTTFVPIGLLLRLVGKDLLKLKADGHGKSYWIVRAPPGPEPESLKEQF